MAPAKRPPASRRNPASDLRGASRLATEAVAGVTEVVEAMHRNIAGLPWILGKPLPGRTTGITGLVYRSVQGVTRLVGGGLDAVLAGLVPLLGERATAPEVEAVVAVLNGVLGDHLAATGNPLATPMQWRLDGRPLSLEPGAPAPAARSGKVAILVHGLCVNEKGWSRLGHDHGAALARDGGYAPVYLRYNSGLHVSTNGRALADLLEELVGRWPVPVEELVIVAHSMGGLVARSACHSGAAAGHRWLGHVRKLVFLGTPHHGAPLERGGNWVDAVLGVSPYTAPLSRLGKIRSAGITDLRYGYLVEGDWAGRDRFQRTGDRRTHVPLPAGVECWALAATQAEMGREPPLPGDGLVPLDSALGRHRDRERSLGISPSRQWIGHGMSHLDLLSRPEAYQELRRVLASRPDELKPDPRRGHGAGPAKRRRPPR